MASQFQRGFKAWCETISLQQRKLLGLAPIDPLDPWKLAGNHDVLVWYANEVPGISPACLRQLVIVDSESWSAVTVHFDGKHAIILNPSHRGARPASDVAHELSHMLIGHEAARVDISEDGALLLHSYSKLQEDEADWLAGSLLLPRDALVHIFRTGMAEEDARSLYGVSARMLQYRMDVMAIRKIFTRRNTAL